MESQDDGARLTGRQWVFVIVLALFAGAIGGILSGGFTLNFFY